MTTRRAQLLAVLAVIAVPSGWLWFGSPVNAVTLGAALVMFVLSVDALLKLHRRRRRLREHRERLDRGETRDYLWEERYGKDYV